MHIGWYSDDLTVKILDQGPDLTIIQNNNAPADKTRPGLPTQSAQPGPRSTKPAPQSVQFAPHRTQPTSQSTKPGPVYPEMMEAVIV